MFSMQLEGEQAFSKHELIVRNLLSVDTRWASRGRRHPVAAGEDTDGPEIPGV